MSLGRPWFLLAQHCFWNLVWCMFNEKWFFEWVWPCNFAGQTRVFRQNCKKCIGGFMVLNLDLCWMFLFEICCHKRGPWFWFWLGPKCHICRKNLTFRVLWLWALAAAGCNQCLASPKIGYTNFVKVMKGISKN